MELTKTYKEVASFIGGANVILADEEFLKKKPSYYVKKQLKKMTALTENYNDKIADLRIEHASVDERGNLSTEVNGAFKFTKENMRKLNADIKKLNEEKVTFDYVFDVSTLDEKTPEHYKEFFNDFIAKDE